MKIKILQMLLVSFAVFAFAGCYADKGNYEYHELDDFYIDNTGIKTSYTAQLFDELVIMPKVVYKGDPANLEYVWKIYPKALSLLTSWSTVLSNEKTLSETITVAPAEYYLEFCITEKNIGRMAIFRYDIKVESTGSGISVLYQRDGLTDFGLITPTWLFGNIEEERVLLDIYTSTNPDHPLTSAPIGIGGYKDNSFEHISLYTEDDAVRLSPIDFSIIEHFKDFFLFPPDRTKIQAYYLPHGMNQANLEQSDAMEVIINDDALWINSTLGSLLGRTFYVERYYVEDFDLAPFFVLTTARVVMFDRKSSRLLQAPMTGGDIVSIRDELGESLNMDPVHLFRNASAWYYINLILRGKGVDAHKHYFYIADLGAYMYGYPNKWDISHYTGIAQAEIFASALRGPITYYASGGKIYQIKYDQMGDTVGDNAIEMWAGTADETITTMKFSAYPGRNLGDFNARDKYLLVGTYNQSTQEGKVYVFEVNLETDGSLIQTPVAVYGGFGKIKDFAYKF